MIDTHCHLDFPDFDKDRQVVIERTLYELDRVVSIGAGLEASRRSVQLAQDYDGVYATAGLHPHNTEPELKLSDEEQLNQLRSLIIRSSKVVAVGESGLDYSTAPPGEKDRDKVEQGRIFHAQIQMAKEFDLPLILHSRVSIEDALNVLLEEEAPRAVFHCFTYGKDWAQKVLDAGHLISFTGIVTFKNAKTVQETAKYVPLDKMMLETDAPFLAPEPYRGRRCEPWMVKYVAEKIAELKGIGVDEVEKVTDESAVNFFQFKKQD